jgi:hypothetical protein
MREEDVLATLSMEPRHASDALVSLFEATVDQIEHALPIEQGMTPAEAQRLRQERAEDADRFRKRSYELAHLILCEAAGLEDGRK